MSEQEPTKSNENLRKLITAAREFEEEYKAHPERFNEADIAVLKQVLGDHLEQKSPRFVWQSGSGILFTRKA